MKEEVLNRFEEKGLDLPFSVLKDGETFTTQKGLPLKSKISQAGTVIFETINAVGGVKIERIEIVGKKKGLLIEVGDEDITGAIFEKREGQVLDDLWNLIKQIKEEKEVAEKPSEKPKVPLSPAILEEFKGILKDYLGDFAERVYQNQLKTQRINLSQIYEDDARRLIFALGKAAGMIIGPTKGKEMTNKLLGKLK
uniref:Uncharacterized protein n=1 Tax=candidate division WOR-3 bacterium TaxID=2052148 RepID=A0A7C4XKC3_UNCW3